MPKTQIDDVLVFEGSNVYARGPLERGPGERMKTLWVRACQRDHHTGESRIAEASFHGDGPPVYDGGVWKLTLAGPATFAHGDASVSAVLVYEDGDDLFTLAWAECAHLVEPEAPAVS